MNSIKMKKLDQCQKLVEHYHSKFPDIPTLTSLAYLEREIANDEASEKPKRYLLVDVRSEAEMAVSMIPGSITLNELESKMKSNPKEVNSSFTVVTYCTIGYRSGLEARRLKKEFNLNGRIANLDGIVSYTHACSCSDREGANLVDPVTKQTTKEVHVFGEKWDCTDESFRSVFFSKPAGIWESVRVGFLAIGDVVRGRT